jgi:hypothetical protein
VSWTRWSSTYIVVASIRQLLEFIDIILLRVDAILKLKSIDYLFV